MHVDVIPRPRPIIRKKDPREVEKRLRQMYRGLKEKAVN